MDESCYIFSRISVLSGGLILKYYEALKSDPIFDHSQIHNRLLSDGFYRYVSSIPKPEAQVLTKPWAADSFMF